MTARRRRAEDGRDLRVVEELEALREATADVGPSPGFVDRVVAAAAAAPPRQSWLPAWLDVGRAWWVVPVAGAAAAAAVLWAVEVRSEIESSRATEDVRAALSSPGGEAQW